MQSLLQWVEGRNESNRETVQAFKRLFNTEDGKLVLRDLEIKFGFQAPSFKNDMNNFNDPRIYVNEGMKMPLNYIHWALQVNPNSFTTRIKANKDTYEGKFKDRPE